MFREGNHPSEDGDVCFYESKGSLIDQAIVLRTGSAIVHVAIFVGGGQTIAAVSGGIKLGPSGDEAHVWTPDGGYEDSRLNHAILWMNTQLGLPYGYADIANQVLSLFGKSAPLLDKSADCSDLACKFLWIAGVSLPADLIETHLVTPGGLYTALSNL